MPEPTTPQLSEAEVERMRARVEGNQPLQLYLTEFGLDIHALIRDWRAMRAEQLEIQRLLASTALEDPTEDDDSSYSTTELVEGVRFLLCMKDSARQRTAALREQLAVVTKERDDLRDGCAKSRTED